MTSAADAERGGRPTPDVTVVVISFNDAGRLPRAIRSIQRQTLRSLEIVVVDDASTDDTSAVVGRLAESDPRIRYVRLEQNSGGCSAPRNTGLGLASAPWVMFCDSDDEYERHACKNLLEAAERTGADIVCGTAERIDVRTGRTRRWRPELHDRPREAGSLEQLPELLYDTISVNKIYRVDLLRRTGIRFPEGLLFEDQLFTLEAMASADRLAVIPEVVYRWYVDRLSEEPSITQRRHEARNVESRVEVNRRIDEFLSARGMADIRAAKDVKFLRHDLYLYLSSMLEVDDETAELLIERLVPYVAALDLDRAWQVRPVLRVAIYHLLVRDLAGLRSAMRFVKWASVVDVPIVRRGDRTLWGSPQLTEGPDVGGRSAADWLDVTELGLLDIPFTQRRYLHRIDEVSFADGRLRAVGSTVDYDGLVPDSTEIELRLLIGGERVAMTVPARWHDAGSGRRRWEAAGPLTDRLRRRLSEKDRGTLAVAMTRDQQVNVTGARASEATAPRVRLPFPGPKGWVGPDSVQLGSHDNGAIGWRAVQASRARGRGERLRRWWLGLPGATRLATFVELVGRDALPRAAGRIARALPGVNTVIVHAGGRVPDPNVSAIAAACRDLRPGVRQRWVYEREPGRMPDGVDTLASAGARHAWAVGRARWVLVDGYAPVPVAVPSRAIVVCARAETPVGRIGLDDPSILVSRAATATVRRQGRQWSALVGSSTDAARLVSEAFGFGGKVIVAGMPRMDGALRAVREAGLADLRGRLDLPGGRPIVVHAPADRPDGEQVLDVEEWAAAGGAGCYLVLRHRPGVTVPTRLRNMVRLLTEEDDLSAHLAAADLVVSDYSPLIGDAVLAGRPVVLFQPDREDYVNRTHGLYPWADGSGPVVGTLGALLAEVDRWRVDPQGWESSHGTQRRTWAERWIGPAEGDSAQRVVEAVFG